MLLSLCSDRLLSDRFAFHGISAANSWEPVRPEPWHLSEQVLLWNVKPNQPESPGGCHKLPPAYRGLLFSGPLSPARGSLWLAPLPEFINFQTLSMPFSLTICPHPRPEELPRAASPRHSQAAASSPFAQAGHSLQKLVLTFIHCTTICPFSPAHTRLLTHRKSR